MTSPLVFVEFNELCPDLIASFDSAGLLPNFRRLREQSDCYTTDAGVSGSLLNPWVQWVTVHTGLNADRHGVTRLNEAHLLNGQFVWDHLSRAGISSWVCGSMNTSYSGEFRGKLVPDPWSDRVKPYPSGTFDAYCEFVGHAVKGHAGSGRLSVRRLMRFLLSSGLRPKTMVRIFSQLFAEKMKPECKWRRASLLDWVQLDLYLKIEKAENPSFSTFFLNSTAHFQHHYWSSDSVVQTQTRTLSSLTSKNDAVEFGYRNMDAVLGEILASAEERGADIMLCTALSQQQYIHSGSGTHRHHYHIHDYASFASTFGVSPNVKYVPVMAEQFQLIHDDEGSASNTYSRLSEFELNCDEAFEVGGNDLFHMSLNENVVYVQCRCTQVVPDSGDIVDRISGDRVRFHEYFYLMKDVKTGTHNPRGVFWTTTNSNKLCTEASSELIPLEAVHSYIIKHFENGGTSSEKSAA